MGGLAARAALLKLLGGENHDAKEAGSTDDQHAERTEKDTDCIIRALLISDPPSPWESARKGDHRK